MRKIWALGWVASVILLLISISKQDIFSIYFSFVFMMIFNGLFIWRKK